MNDPIEDLAREFHGVYQDEARRQGDVRHADSYDDLSENVKEFDRVLARHVAARIEGLQKDRDAAMARIDWEMSDGPLAERNEWMRKCERLREVIEKALQIEEDNYPEIAVEEIRPLLAQALADLDPRG